MHYHEKARWSMNQENFIRTNYMKMSDEQMSILLGRTKKAVRRKRERMLLPKPMGRKDYTGVAATITGV